MSDTVWGRAVEAAFAAFREAKPAPASPYSHQPRVEAALAAALPVLLADLADRIEDEGRDDVEFLVGDKTPSGLGRTVGAEDAYKAAIRIVRSFASEVSGE